MNTSATLHRWTAAGLLATTLLLSVAPAAEAGNRFRRYKGVERSEHRTVSRVVVREHSGAGPVLAGLIGGDHRHPRVVRVIEIETGRCVRDLRWYDGGWHEEDMDWDD